MERKFPVEHFRKFRYTSQGCPLYRKFRKILFHSSLGISKIQLGIFYQIESARRYWFSRLNFGGS